MNLSPLPLQKFFDNNGRPLNGGLLFTYIAGTNTKLATYSDQSGTLNTNPVVLNFRGEANVWLDTSQTYKFVLSPQGDTDPPSNPFWTVDNISTPLTSSTLPDALTYQIVANALYTTTVDGFHAQFYADRLITTTADYGFLDDSTIQFASGGTIGHASFATRVRYESSNADDHHHDFQARSQFNFTSTLNQTSAFWTQSEIFGGAITDMYLFKGLNPIKTGGTISNLYGLYLSELNQGANNFAIWTDGPTPSRFGRILAGSGSHIDNSDISISDDATPGLALYCETAGLNLKLWDVYADTSGIQHFRHITDNLAFNNDWMTVKASGSSSGIAQVIFPFSMNNGYLFGSSSTILANTFAQFVAPASVGGTTVKVVSNNFAVHYCWNADTTGNNIFCDFGTEGTYTSRGSIDYNRGGTAVRYNTTSDERLKTNIVSAPSAGSLIDAIQVRSFDWKENGHHVVHGFIAQELNTVAPEAVSEGSETRSWGVDPSKLVPMLVKEIQELRQRVAALEAR